MAKYRKETGIYGDEGQERKEPHADLEFNRATGRQIIAYLCLKADLKQVKMYEYSECIEYRWDEPIKYLIFDSRVESTITYAHRAHFDQDRASFLKESNNCRFHCKLGY